jgi:uncharacterized membrane protein YfcA
MLRLVFIGVVAGVFSALFGVGGGIVIVPLLILLAGVPTHVAAATSLAAIGITALAGATRYGFEGHLDVGYAVLAGLPAAVGAVFGATLAQRIDPRPLTLAFAALLASIAVWLVV